MVTLHSSLSWFKEFTHSFKLSLYILFLYHLMFSVFHLVTSKICLTFSFELQIRMVESGTIIQMFVVLEFLLRSSKLDVWSPCRKLKEGSGRLLGHPGFSKSSYFLHSLPLNAGSLID